MLKMRRVALAYGLLLAAAYGWMTLRGDAIPGLHPERLVPPEPAEWARDLALGVAGALAAAVASRLMSHHFAWARRLDRLFAQVLGRLSVGRILFFAVSSGVAEEAFFRGAMQPTLGLWPTALLFGMLHIGPNRTFLPWTILALGMGVVLGIFYERTGNLTAPVTCHVLLNTLELFALRHLPPPGPEERESLDSDEEPW